MHKSLIRRTRSGKRILDPVMVSFAVNRLWLAVEDLGKKNQKMSTESSSKKIGLKDSVHNLAPIVLPKPGSGLIQPLLGPKQRVLFGQTVGYPGNH